MRSLVDSLPRELRDRFDLVSFDPRGVGDSGAVKCGADIDPLFDQSFSPTDAAERSALVAAFRTVVDACARDSGALLPHVSTVDTARDLDRVRAAIGDRKLTYVGESYGTYLGTIYATLFPERVRAIVLDGAIDPGGRRHRGGPRAGARVRSTRSTSSSPTAPSSAAARSTTTASRARPTTRCAPAAARYRAPDACATRAAP